MGVAEILLIVLSGYWVATDLSEPEPVPMCYTKVQESPEVWKWVECETVLTKEEPDGV